MAGLIPLPGVVKLPILAQMRQLQSPSVALCFWIWYDGRRICLMVVFFASCLSLSGLLTDAAATTVVTSEAGWHSCSHDLAAWCVEDTQTSCLDPYIAQSYLRQMQHVR